MAASFLLSEVLPAGAQIPPAWLEHGSKLSLPGNMFNQGSARSRPALSVVDCKYGTCPDSLAGLT
jgi:hypothetical protein